MEHMPSGEYLDAANVLRGGARDELYFREHAFSRVIEADRVRLLTEPVTPPWGPRKESVGIKEAGGITVDVVREGGRVAGLRIACACGRHAELGVEYAEGEGDT